MDRLCNRKACRAPGANWWSAIMRAWYCQPCAFLLNDVAERDGAPERQLVRDDELPATPTRRDSDAQ